MSSPVDILLKANDQAIDIKITDGMIDSPVTEITDATVTVTILDSSGAAVSPGGGPLSAPWNSTDHVYRALISETFNPAAGPGYRIKILATTPGGGDGQWYRDAYVREG